MFAIATCAAALPVAAATIPVALVMEVNGATIPPVTAYQELSADQKIALAKGTRVAVLHYSTCTITTLKGGSVRTTDAGLDTATADVESSRPGPCPRVHRVSLSGQATSSGVVISRSIAPAKPTMQAAANGTIVLTGAGAARAVSVDIVDASRNVVMAPVSAKGGLVRLSGTSALAPGTSYVLRVKLDGADDPVTVPLTIAAAPLDSPLILRLE